VQKFQNNSSPYNYIAKEKINHFEVGQPIIFYYLPMLNIRIDLNEGKVV